MRRHFVLGFPRALLYLSQEKISGVEIGRSVEYGPLIKPITVRVLSERYIKPGFHQRRKHNRKRKGAYFIGKTGLTQA